MRPAPRRSGALFVLSLTFACASGEKGGGGAPADTAGGASDGASDGGAAGDGGGPDTAAPTLNGTRPAEALPAPDFTATNRDGAARDREDLLGGPTVMWFYPAATTAG